MNGIPFIKISNIHYRRIYTKFLTLPIICLYPLFIIKDNALLIAILYISVYVLSLCCQPLLNTIGYRMEQCGYKTNFGFSRSFGSIGYSITCFFIGSVFNKLGSNYVPIFSYIGYVLFFLSLIWTNNTFKGLKEVNIIENKEDSVSFLQFLKENTKLIIIDFAIALFYIGMKLQSTFLLQIIEQFGGTTAEQGKLQFMWALLEVPVMVSFNKINQKLKLETLLIISSIAFFVRMVAMYLANNMLSLAFALSLEWCSFALFTPAIVKYININAKENQTARAQAIYLTFLSIDSSIVCLFSGYIIEHFSVKKLLEIACIITFIGVVIFIYTIVKKQTKKDK